MRPRTSLALVCLIWLAVVLVVPFLGSRILSPSDVINDEAVASIFWTLRFPRTLLALLCGLAFAPVFRWGSPLAAFILLLVHVLLDGLDDIRERWVSGETYLVQ